MRYNERKCENLYFSMLSILLQRPESNMKFVFNLEYTESFQVLVGKRRDLMGNFLVSSLNAEIFLRQDKMERS
jgi:hypothetical protein